ncbi:MAG TPA: proton-conducting transporter membrane subunit [Anaerohalosphaeraceae bacterium]|nr:proton-conducting transporter membrane subunit [Anaerohalosphaeraceae bacterium]
MSLFIGGFAIIFIGGLASLFCGRRGGLASLCGVLGTAAGSAAAIIPAFKVLFSGAAESVQIAWAVPFGSFCLRLDPLSAFFLIPILGLSSIAAVYGVEYLSSYQSRKNLGVPWFFYALLLVGMMLVVAAGNGLLFLIAWEIMSVASFFLVSFEYEKPAVRQAGLSYLIAMHIGTAFLILFFILLSSGTGSLDFDKIPMFPAAKANLLFLLAVVGFGTKAGFMPLHVWLPHAHPAAPSHVSAVMSGVMIKTGIYGLVRAAMLLGTPPAWWGWLLIMIGAVSGILGVLFALAQHDLKRLLAYHSVENIGIITIGLGVGLLGVHLHSPILAVLGFAGGLFHVLNHAVFKGLLFLCAGSVLHSSGTGCLDKLGGLIKRMPWTASAFLVGAAAISGLPPLNGFASEFLLYLGVFKNNGGDGLEMLVLALIVIGSLALIGGLALACFTKAFGIVFLGHPRSGAAQESHEAGVLMKLSMAVLACLCVLLGLLSPWVVRSAAYVIAAIAPFPMGQIEAELGCASSVLLGFVFISLVFAIVLFGLTAVRCRLLKSRCVRQSVTWDCGYARPDSRMQYTATSFAQPITALFNVFLQTRKKFLPPEGLFPVRSSFETETPDLGERYLYLPLYRWICALFGKLQWLQHGRVQIYIFYIALTLWLLLMWKLM